MEFQLSLLNGCVYQSSTLKNNTYLKILTNDCGRSTDSPKINIFMTRVSYLQFTFSSPMESYAVYIQYLNTLFMVPRFIGVRHVILLFVLNYSIKCPIPFKILWTFFFNGYNIRVREIDLSTLLYLECVRYLFDVGARMYDVLCMYIIFKFL